MLSAFHSSLVAASSNETTRIFVKSSSLYSDDDLTKIRVVSFEDAATRDEWKADSTVKQFQSDRKTYNTNNSISHTASFS